jgi:hypothetical protein
MILASARISAARTDPQLKPTSRVTRVSGTPYKSSSVNQSLNGSPRSCADPLDPPLKSVLERSSAALGLNSKDHRRSLSALAPQINCPYSSIFPKSGNSIRVSI